jgi:hypothetical protein
MDLKLRGSLGRVGAGVKGKAADFLGFPQKSDQKPQISAQFSRSVPQKSRISAPSATNETRAPESPERANLL